MTRLITFCLLLFSIIFMTNVVVMNDYAGIIITSFAIGVIIPLMFDRIVVKKMFFMLWFLIIAVITVISKTSYPQLCLIMLSAILCLVVTAVTQLIKSDHIRKVVRTISLLLFFFYLASNSTSISKLIHSRMSNRVAYLERGKWGRSDLKSKGLCITSQYAYGNLVKALDADRVTGLSDITSYSELWVVTPTCPFKTKEIHDILQWVLRGGKLVVVSDHSDLFGHSSVLSPLLSCFFIKSLKNTILDKTGDGGLFQTLFSENRGMTANSFQGRGIAWAIQNGYSERTDYSAPSFFSDLQISDEEVSGVFPIAVTSQFGLGSVVLFGDSTQFSNFALSRPSSQFFLSKIVNGGTSFPVAEFAGFFVVLLLAVIGSSLPCRVASVSIGLFLLILYGLSLRCKPSPLCFSKLNPIEVSGDWALVDEAGGFLSTLFAANHECSDRFPLWTNLNDKSGKIFLKGKLQVPILADSPPSVYFNKFAYDSILLRLNANPSCSTEGFLEHLIQSSSRSSYWFDDGVGLFREVAYRTFWARLSADKYSVLPDVESVGSFDGILIASATDRKPVTVRVSCLPGYPSWVIIGDWVIGQRLSDGRILIRSIWQSPSWGHKDLVFVPFLVNELRLGTYSIIAQGML